MIIILQEIIICILALEMTCLNPSGAHIQIIIIVVYCYRSDID